MGAALVVSLLVAMTGMMGSVFLLSLIIGTAVLWLSLKYLEVGVLLIVFLGFFLNIIKIFTLTEVPLGTAIDILLILLFISIWYKSHVENKNILSKGVFTSILLVYFAYQIFEVLNPIAYSKAAWLFAFRQMFSVYMIFFIFSYAFQNIAFVTKFLKIWIVLSLFAALYGLSQEFFGFRDFEMRWLNANPEVAIRYFTFGKWRRFSIFTGPMDFGIMMAFTSVICIALYFGPFQYWKRIFLGISAFVMLWAMMYTGTRTAYILFPAGFVFYAILTFKKQILLVLALFLVAGTIVIMRPATNQTVFVLQTAFMGKKDASYMVREKNKEFIRPFLKSNPLGGGIGSCGMVGKRYSPGSFLAGFPPDSEFVKVAIEQGWIGLLLFCLLFATAMHLGINNYFQVENPRIKAYYAAILSALFMIIVGSYPQEALQLTINIFVGASFALLVRMKDLDSIADSYTTIEKT